MLFAAATRSAPQRLADSRHRAQLNFRELAERFEQLSQVLPDALRCVQDVKEMQVRGCVCSRVRVRARAWIRERVRARPRRVRAQAYQALTASRTLVQGATSERLEVLEGRMQSEEAYLTSLQELQEAVISQSGTIQDDIKVRLAAFPDGMRRRGRSHRWVLAALMLEVARTHTPGADGATAAGPGRARKIPARKSARRGAAKAVNNRATA